MLDQKQRQIFCKFRISSHDYQTEVEKRICKLCNAEIEDEFHFLLKCHKLEEKRWVVLSDS